MQTNYASYEDYEQVVEESLEDDDKVFLWNVYQIRRAIDVVCRFEEQFTSYIDKIELE